MTERLAASLSRAKRVLFVDDNHDFLAALGAVAAGFNMRMVLAGSIAEAREVMLNEGGPGAFAGIVLDVQLTNGDGVALYREIAEAAPEVQVVFLTAFATPKLRERVEAIGPASVHEKINVARPAFIEKLFLRFGVKKLSASAASFSPFPA